MFDEVGNTTKLKEQTVQCRSYDQLQNGCHAGASETGPEFPKVRANFIIYLFFRLVLL